MSQNKPLLIGITGGIGAGKTTVCGAFRALGIPVYEADSRARILQETNVELIEGITVLFGEKAYINQKLNRTLIAQLVFSDRTKLAQLNALVHPKVQEDFEQWTRQYSTSPFLLKEAALIFETGGNKHLDSVIVCVCNDNFLTSR